MKKILAALCLMMSLPTLTLAAGQNMVSVSELHRQAEEMGRWQKTYATPNGELNVDIPILVPDVEKCPVITVENDRPFTQETADEMLKTAFKRDGITMFCYEMDGQTVDVDWATLGMGTTEDYESAKEFGMNAGEWRYGEWPNYGSTPIDYRYPWELDMDSSYIRGGDQTVAQALAALQQVPQDLYEAAEIDGCGAWKKFVNVTLPAIRGTILFALIELTIGGFTSVYGSWASLIAAVAMCCFAFSTIIGWGLYGTRCLEFLVGSKANRGFMIVYSFVAIVGATMDLGLLWDAADTFNGMMVIPNLIALFLLSGTVAKLTKKAG